MLWKPTGKVLDTCWKRFGSFVAHILASCCEPFGNISETLWEPFGTFVGDLLGVFVDILETFRRSFGNLFDTC